MKKNLILTVFLAALLLGTYVFQELRTENKFKEYLVKDHLVQVEDLKSLSWGDVDAVKKNGQWWSGENLLSSNTFKQIERRLAQIKKIKSIEGDRNKFFSSPTEVKVNGELWTFGDLTLDRQGFYLAKGNELMIAISAGESQELVKSPDEVLEKKVSELRRAFNYTLDELYENQLFRHYPKLPLGTVTIDSDGRPSYELNFDKNTTSPAPIKGIEVHDRLLDKFVSLLTQITLKKLVPYSEDLKFSKIGQMVFKNEAEEEVTWELWLSSEKSADSFIIDNHRKKAWLMTGGTLRAFFIQVQDYWDKKVIPPSKFSNFSRLKTTLTQGEKSAVVEIINREPFAFETGKHKVDSEKMNILFQYVLNLSDKDQADRVSQLSSSERKELLSGNHLKIEIFGQDLILWRKADELIVVNLTQGYKAHFIVSDQNFRAGFEDVLK